jgi:hypothetical protein
MLLNSDIQKKNSNDFTFSKGNKFMKKKKIL